MQYVTLSFVMVYILTTAITIIHFIVIYICKYHDYATLSFFNKIPFHLLYLYLQMLYTTLSSVVIKSNKIPFQLLWFIYLQMQCIKIPYHLFSFMVNGLTFWTIYSILFCYILLFMHLFFEILSEITNNVDPDQTTRAVWSGSTLFAYAIF